MEKLLTVVKAVIFTLAFGIACCSAFEDCNASYMQGSAEESPGKCVSFDECPTLLSILKSPYKTVAEIRLLQKLTCKPDNNNPTICCAIEDIVSDTDNYNRGPPKRNATKVPPVDNSERIVFGQDANSLPSSENKESIPKLQVTDDDIHANFRLMPTLQECSNTVNSDRILGGKEASILDYPWMARIGYWSHEDEAIKYLCGGTVINKRYILTAAHCTQEINLDEFEPREIRLAEKDKTCDEHYGCSTPLDLEIEDIIPHPHYSKKDKSNDIGLIRVKEDIPYAENMFISPVCLPFVEDYGLKQEDLDISLTKYFDTGKAEAVVAGWGKTRWTASEGSPSLQYVNLPVLSQNQCQKNYRNISKVIITEKQLCAGGERGKDSCGGDSGGGLFLNQKVPVTAKIKKVKPFQFGVVSFGPTHCGVGGLPGVYSNVYAYRKWILDQLKP